jgi:alkylhydroperoxidase family enzyme
MNPICKTTKRPRRNGLTAESAAEALIEALTEALRESNAILGAYLTEIRYERAVKLIRAQMRRNRKLLPASEEQAAAE